MSTDLPRPLLHIAYEKAAEAYLRGLPPEHFMEATPQATQRMITLESLDLVHAHRPEMQFFNELLVQYPYGRGQQIRQVVPDNMVVIHPEPIKAGGSYDLPFQPVGPFWVLEYVSKHSERKDYDESFRKYERDLKAPYYLAFYPEIQELTLFHHNGKKYVSVKPNAQGRRAIPELDLEMGLMDGWVRFWYRGELLPLPAELQRALDEARRQLRKVTQRAATLELRVEEERQGREAAEQELARLRNQLEQMRAKDNT